ncbi:hypothetical protein EE612_033830, partial [Oryza sativa]
PPHDFTADDFTREDFAPPPPPAAAKTSLPLSRSSSSPRVLKLHPHRSSSLLLPHRRILTARSCFFPTAAAILLARSSSSPRVLKPHPRQSSRCCRCRILLLPHRHGRIRPRPLPPSPTPPCTPPLAGTEVGPLPHLPLHHHQISNVDPIVESL